MPECCHAFPVRTDGELGPDNAPTLGDDPLVLHADWAPHGFSASATVRGGLVHGGHGPTIDLSRTIAMLNLDVVGRLEGGPLTVRPGDDWERIDADGLARVIELAVGVAPDPAPRHDAHAEVKRRGPAPHACSRCAGLRHWSPTHRAIPLR